MKSVEFLYTLNNVDAYHSKSVSLNNANHPELFEKQPHYNDLEPYLLGHVHDHDYYTTFDDDEVISIDAIKVDGKYIRGSYELD
mgnify:CR=1 FL=1